MLCCAVAATYAANKAAIWQLTPLPTQTKHQKAYGPTVAPLYTTLTSNAKCGGGLFTTKTQKTKRKCCSKYKTLDRWIAGSPERRIALLLFIVCVCLLRDLEFRLLLLALDSAPVGCFEGRCYRCLIDLCEQSFSYPKLNSFT